VLKAWSKRHRDLGSSRTQVVCRLHAVLCELVPGGVAKKIIAAHAARLLDLIGIPRDMGAARALFDRSPFDFERWAVFRVKRPAQREPEAARRQGRRRRGALLPRQEDQRQAARVRQGRQNLGPQFVRDLIGTVETQKVQMGVLITMSDPTSGVIDAANHDGLYEWTVNGQTFPKIQVITIADLPGGKRPSMPAPMLPHIQATRAAPSAPEQVSLFGDAEIDR
jgi:hypothetical protein